MRIKDWEKFQHYKNRKPPWIKLYKDILDDPEWFALSDKAAKILVMLWLIASDNGNDGKLPAIKKLAFRLRMSEQELTKVISELKHWVAVDASTMLAGCLHDATPETETEKKNPSSPKGDGDGGVEYSKPFLKFWEAYPKKKSKGDAFKAWRSQKCHLVTDEIIEAVTRQSKSHDWTKSGGQYIPHPGKYLRARAWEDEDDYEPEAPRIYDPLNESGVWE